MTSAVAVVDQRNGSFYVQSWDYSAGRYPMLSQGIWLTKVGTDSAAELGSAVRAALAQSRSGVTFTLERRAEQHKSRLALRRLARVRGETQYQTGLSSIKVEARDGEADLEITIYDNPDPRQNMTARPGRVYVTKDMSDEELGSRISELLIAPP